MARKINENEERRFKAFTEELAQLSIKYGIALECTGGVYFGNIKDIEYNTDYTSDTDHFKTLQNQYLSKLSKMARFKQMSIPEISQRSGLTEANVRRMLEGRYSVTMQNFLRLVDAIDCKLELI